MARYPKNERGAAMLEGALVAPVVFFLLFIVFQAAFVGRSYISSRDAPANGARAASVDATLPVADFDMITAVKRSMDSSSAKQIDKIVVFKATGYDSAVPAPCLVSKVNGVCNVYTPADLNHSAADFEAGTVVAANAWPATSRSASLLTGTDFIGVYVELSVTNSASPFPVKLHHVAITRLDPLTN